MKSSDVAYHQYEPATVFARDEWCKHCNCTPVEHADLWPGSVLVRVADLREGDRVDLEGDQYADPRHDNSLAEYEYAEVVYVEQETPQCVRVDFHDYDSVGFPTDHLLRLAGTSEAK